MNRKTLTALCVASLGTIGLANPAFAYSFSPKSSKVSGYGAVSFVDGGSRKACSATFSGATDSAGVLKISKISFQVCSSPGPTGLPWTVKATSSKKATIYGMAYTNVFGGACGPGNLPITVSSSFVSGFAFDSVLKGKCRFEGAFTIKEFLSIVK
jgi:hypothetical protein